MVDFGTYQNVLKKLLLNGSLDVASFCLWRKVFERTVSSYLFKRLGGCMWNFFVLSYNIIPCSQFFVHQSYHVYCINRCSNCWTILWHMCMRFMSTIQYLLWCGIPNWNLLFQGSVVMGDLMPPQVPLVFYSLFANVTADSFSFNVHVLNVLKQGNMNQCFIILW